MTTLRETAQEIVDLYQILDSMNDEVRMWRENYFDKEYQESGQRSSENKYRHSRLIFLALPSINFMKKTPEENFKDCEKLL